MHFCGKLNNVAVYEYEFYQEQICVENPLCGKFSLFLTLQIVVMATFLN